MKKAQGLSFNTIIIAALGLVVMVVIFFVFNSNVGKSTDNLNSCHAKGGECDDDCGPQRPVKILAEQCDLQNKKFCCLPLGDSIKKHEKETVVPLEDQ